MRAAFAAVVLALTMAVVPGPPAGRPATPAWPPLIGAHYYPWYAPDRWANQPATDTPALGRYRSADPAVVARHVRWARAADLDFFVLSCLDPAGPEAKTLREVTVPGLAAAGFRFALHYETPIALGLRPELPIDFAARLPDGTVAGDRFVQHFDYLANTYFTHPCYLRHDGRAVVMLYLVRNWENAGPYLRAVRDRLAGRGIDLYLIADAMYWERPGELDWPFLEEHFRAVTAYNMYHRPDFLAGVRRQYDAADRAARARGLRMIPHVLPGYDDTRLRGTDRATLPRRGGVFYREFWRLGAEFVGPDQPFLIVTTFNEWHEGTELEPSAEHGDLYLRLTRELAADLRNR
ncbi:MAG: glycoside hydrolase family 99-like domain-containing protein [Gemmataceae bacterium]|nr:glycoside hydrolase family 99-like domain-containing protein [Gemmataceae bacterium]